MAVGRKHSDGRAAAHLQVWSVTFCGALEREPVQSGCMRRTDVYPPVLAATPNNNAHYRFLRCGYILSITYERKNAHTSRRGTIVLTRRELPSIHHRARFAECWTSPARVETTAVCPFADGCFKSPGPSLRLTCWAGTSSPGRTEDMIVKREEAEMAGRASDDSALSFIHDYDQSLRILPLAN